jgi:hypothetical protein
LIFGNQSIWCLFLWVGNRTFAWYFRTFLSEKKLFPWIYKLKSQDENWESVWCWFLKIRLRWYHGPNFCMTFLLKFRLKKSKLFVEIYKLKNQAGWDPIPDLYLIFTHTFLWKNKKFLRIINVGKSGWESKLCLMLIFENQAEMQLGIELLPDFFNKITWILLSNLLWTRQATQMSNKWKHVFVGWLISIHSSWTLILVPSSSCKLIELKF